MRPSASLRHFAIPLTAALLALAPAGAAFAQTAASAAVSAAPSGSAADEAAPGKHHTKHATLAQRFAEANVTHDGHLTLDQARAGLPMAARHFAAMDKDNKGYVTLDDIHGYLKAQRAAKHHALPEDAPEKS